MSNTIFSFLLSIIAGFSTLLGTLPIFMKQNTKIVVGALSFAAGIMMTVSIVDLLPNSFRYIQTIFQVIPTFLILLIFLIVGILFSMLIDTYFPTTSISKESKLWKVGIFSMVAMIAHNIPEGIATFMTTSNNTTLGITLTIAIALHNIPEGIGIAIPIYYATKCKGKAIFYTLISGMSELFGALIAYLFLYRFMNDLMMGLLLAMIAGIMIHISVYELIPTSKSYHDNKISYQAFFLGIIMMLFSHIFFS